MPNSENTQEGEPNKAEISAERQSLLQSIDQWLDPPLAFLSLIWVVLLLVELTVPLSPEDSSRVFRVDFAIWLIFVVDFVLEFVIAPDKLR